MNRRCEMSDKKYEFRVVAKAPIDGGEAIRDCTPNEYATFGTRIEDVLPAFDNALPTQGGSVQLFRREVTDWEVIQERVIESRDTIMRRKEAETIYCDPASGRRR